MTEKTRILIADDHPIFRSGLRAAIETQPTFEVVAEASDGEEALRLITELLPDIVVLDVKMPKLTGFLVVEELGKKGLSMDVIILTMHDEEAIFAKAMDLGVRGYVLKDGAAVEIVNCLEAVRRGQRFTSAAVTSFLFKRAGMQSEMGGLDTLTATERVVLRLISEYKTSREIASELGISHRTVENHRNNICSKLDVHGSHGLAKFIQKHRAEI